MRTGLSTITHRHHGRFLTILIVFLLVVLLPLSPSALAALQRGDTGENPVPTIDDDTREWIEDILTGSGPTPEDDDANATATDDAISSFTSHEFGFEVSFAGPWSYLGSWTDNDQTTHHLTSDEVVVDLYVGGWEWTGEITVLDQVVWWSDPGFIADWSPGAQALPYTATATDGAVVYVYPPTEEFPETWIYVKEVHVVDPYAIEVTLIAPLADFPDAYESVMEMVSVDGTPLLGMFTLDEIEQMLPRDVTLGS